MAALDGRCEPMKARWLACIGLLLVVVAAMVARTRGGRPSSAGSRARGGPSVAPTERVRASEMRAGGPRPALPSRLRRRVGGGDASARDLQLAAMSDAIEGSRAARTEAQRLAADELGLGAPTRAAVAEIFAQERRAVTSLDGTAAMSDAVHGDLIDQRKRRLADLLGQARAEQFNEVYTRHWLDMLSAVYPPSEAPVDDEVEPR